MNLPNNFAEVKESAKLGGRPTPGAYVCKVMRVQDSVSKSGRPMLVIDLDILGGPFDRFFSHDNDSRAERNLEPKWLRYYQVYDGRAVGIFKKMLRDFDRSNESFIAPAQGGFFNERSLEGLQIGALCDGEEYAYNDKTLLDLRPAQLYSVEEILGGKIPKPRIRGVDGTWRDADAPPPKPRDQNGNELEHVDDVDIPF